MLHSAGSLIVIIASQAAGMLLHSAGSLIEIFKARQVAGMRECCLTVPVLLL